MVRIYNFFYGIMWSLLYFFGGCFAIAAIEKRQTALAVRSVPMDGAILAIASIAVIAMVRCFCYGCAGRLAAPRVPKPAKA